MEDLTEKSRRDRSGTGGRRGTRRDSRDGDEMQQEGGGHVFRSRDGGPMRGNPNNDEQGGRGESSQVGERKRSGGTWDRGGRTRSVDLEDFVEVKRSGRSRDYRETGDGRQGVVWEEATSRCVATYGWIAEEGAGVARGIVRVGRPAKRRQVTGLSSRKPTDGSAFARDTGRLTTSGSTISGAGRGPG
jgi:hypothetical protein